MFRSDVPVFQFRGPWGVPIQITASLLLIPLLYLSLSNGSEMLFYNIVFVGMLLGSILLHELGHAWGALVQGIPVRRILLHGGGGFCEHEGDTTPYEQELIIAMGPIVNLAIWAICSLIAPGVENMTWAWALYWMAYINLFLAIFNLLPVMPLDGGRLFALFLLRLFPEERATAMAGWVGVVLTLMWLPGMIWVFFNFGLVLFFIPPLWLHWQMTRAGA
ncbi:MAG: site-2 protease family protein [Litoreibacter sp.]|nr:site-2 protease family protein [Litoreibacter sp.]